MKQFLIFATIFTVSLYVSAEDNQMPNIGGVMDKTIMLQDAFNPLDGVLAYDKEDGYLTVSVTGSVNTAVSGEYTLGYSVTDSSTTNSKSLLRKVTVLPAGKFAVCKATGRRGPHNIINLNAGYLNHLATDITFIKPVFDAINDAVYEYKLIEYYWDGNSAAGGNPDIGVGHKPAPPSASEWAAATTQPFYKDLYLCKKPRIDRWLKMFVSSNGQTNEWVYGLKGDNGVLFHSAWMNKDYYRLSAEVDDPQTVVDQYAAYGQAATYWCNFPRYIQKMMGCHAEVTTIGSLTGSYEACNKAELHGQLITLRAFMSGIDKKSPALSNWAKIKTQWDFALGRAMNTSYTRSYVVPISEPKFTGAYITRMTDLLQHLRSTYNTKRIYCVGGNTGNFMGLKNFYDAHNPYFKSAWHKGHFESMRGRFPWTLTLPYYVQYARINEVWDHDMAAKMFETHREIHKLAQETHVEAAMLDKMGNLARNADGSWSEWSLMYLSMWFCYSGSDYLNNSIFFIDDWDGDGISNQEEHTLNSNPFNPDTDGDFVFDGNEKKWGMDLLNPADAGEDWDNDRISNYNEILWTMTSPGAGAGLGPTLPVSITNAAGNFVGMNINDPTDAVYDTDHDLLPVWFEIMTKAAPDHLFPPKNGLKQFISDIDVARIYFGLTKQLAYNYDLIGGADVDGDGVTNIVELAAGLDPHNASDSGGDFDGDGISNTNEIAAGTSLVGDDATPVEFNHSIVKRVAYAGQAYSGTSLAWDVGAPDVGEFHTFQKQSGPAWLTLASTGRLTGSPGTTDIGWNSWTVKVSAGNGQFHITTLKIRVATAPMEYYGAWASAYNLADTNLLADPDGDKFVNLLEYALGRNPQTADSSGVTWQKLMIGNAGELTFPKRNDANTRGLGYYIETTGDLIEGIWSNGSFSIIGTGSINSEFNSITNRIPTHTDAQFFRLKVKMDSSQN